MNNGRGRLAIVAATAAVALAAAPAAFASKGAVSNNFINIVIERVEDDFTPGAAFFFMMDVNIEDETGVTLVKATSPIVQQLETEEDEPGLWNLEIDFADFASMKAAMGGLWTIEIEGSSPSTTQFTLDLTTLVDGDLFPVATMVTPTSGETDVDPNVVFEWNDPTGEGTPDLLFVDVEVDASGVYEEAMLPVATTVWDPVMVLDSGGAEFALMYLEFDDANRSTAFNVTSGDIAWGDSPFAPEGYPASTPLVVIGSEKIIAFQVGEAVCLTDVDGDDMTGFSDLLVILSAWGPCFECIADIDGNGTVGFSDLLEVLSSWGPCAG